MFKNFLGFNLVEQMHKLRHNKIFNPLKIKRKTYDLWVKSLKRESAYVCPMITA